MLGIDLGLALAVLATAVLAYPFIGMWRSWETDRRKREFIYSTLWKLCIIWGACLAISFIVWIGEHGPHPDEGTAIRYTAGMWALILLTPFFFWRAGKAYEKFSREMHTQYGDEFDIKALEEEYGPELADKIISRWSRGLRGNISSRRLL